MNKFVVTSEKTGAQITIPDHVQNIRDAVTWAQNYCDLSQEPWNVEQVKYIYHIFTHNTDEYTTDEKEAYELYNQFVRDYDSARLYIIKKDGDFDDGDCLESHGIFPN